MAGLSSDDQPVARTSDLPVSRMPLKPELPVPSMVLGPNLGRPDLISKITSPELYGLSVNLGTLGFPPEHKFPFADKSKPTPPPGTLTIPATDIYRVPIVPFKKQDGTSVTRPPGLDTAPPRQDVVQPRRDVLPPVQVNSSAFPADYSRELRLRHTVGHGGTDAVIHIPKGFDPSKPINVVIYNHGHRATVGNAYRDNNFGAEMANAPPNTILIVPEWQTKPGSNSGAQGKFASNGFFDGMVQEIFDKTPGLQGKRLSDIASVGIISHSAGYNPTESILYRNTLGAKVNSITMLDSTYNPTGLDPWIKANIRDLAAGTKRFVNIYQDTTANSQAQEQRVRQWLSQAGLPASAMGSDRDVRTVLSADQLASRGIIFKASNATIGGLGPHGSLPKLYFGRVEQAAAIRARRGGR